MKLKAILLDFGGVLLNIDYQAPIREFKKLGIENFGEQFQQARQSSLMDDFEKGKMSNALFRSALRKLSGKEISDQQIDDAWNSILLDFPEKKMQLLQQLSKKYALFLLSNTNKIHIDSFMGKIDRVYGENYFQHFFKKIYFSSSIGMRKPDDEVFDFVVKDSGFRREEICFIDDSIQHVLAAQKLGIKSLHLDLKKEDLGDLLKREKVI